MQNIIYFLVMKIACLVGNFGELDVMELGNLIVSVHFCFRIEEGVITVECHVEVVGGIIYELN